MSILKNPNEISENISLSGLIYGQPGIGKSTLALSAPTPVLIDADRGMRRVEKRFQVPCLPLTDYKDILDLFQSHELDPFETVVFDTLGKLVDRMGEYLIKQNPKHGKSDGALTMQGWGALKIEFQKLLKMAQSKDKHLIFVAHEKEDKDGDTRIVRPDVSGSSGKDLVKDLDFMGYMEMRGNKRTISFTPTEKYYAKNALRLDPVLNVPDTAEGNKFLQDAIIERTKERLKEDDIENKKYTDLVDGMKEIISKVEDAKGADMALDAINKSEIIWDSQRVAKSALNEKIKEIGLEYDKKTSKFIVKKEEKKEEKTEGK